MQAEEVVAQPADLAPPHRQAAVLQGSRLNVAEIAGLWGAAQSSRIAYLQ